MSKFLKIFPCRSERALAEKRGPALLIQSQVYNEYRNCRVIQEYTHILKQGGRCLAIVKPKENIGNAFDYESYFKMSVHNKTITLTNAEKFFGKKR